jgi:predicted SAM-dependent methyltransferase
MELVMERKISNLKIHLGCGHEILDGFVNLDSAQLPGVDVVHDLGEFPWPFGDGEAKEIIIKHVLEHLPNTIKVMEEIWRICAPGTEVTVRVPYWNSSDFITDPTHVKAFNEGTFNFFDPTHPVCQKRPYYSKARFRIKNRYYFVRIFGKYLAIRFEPFCFALECLSQYFCNIIQVMEFTLVAIK